MTEKMNINTLIKIQKLFIKKKVKETNKKLKQFKKNMKKLKNVMKSAHINKIDKANNHITENIKETMTTKMIEIKENIEKKKNMITKIINKKSTEIIMMKEKEKKENTRKKKRKKWIKIN